VLHLCLFWYVCFVRQQKREVELFDRRHGREGNKEEDDEQEEEDEYYVDQEEEDDDEEEEDQEPFYS
jgi:phage-related protein